MTEGTMAEAEGQRGTDTILAPLDKNLERQRAHSKDDEVRKVKQNRE